MGSNFASDLANGELGISKSIEIHLTANHYPPVPTSMVLPCIEAIYAVNDGNPNSPITLPEGVSWRGQSSAPAYAIVEGHHLDAWLDWQDDE